MSEELTGGLKPLRFGQVRAVEQTHQVTFDKDGAGTISGIDYRALCHSAKVERGFYADELAKAMERLARQESLIESLNSTVRSERYARQELEIKHRALNGAYDDLARARDGLVERLESEQRGHDVTRKHRDVLGAELKALRSRRAKRA